MSFIHFWHAPLGMCSAECRHQSPEWTILSHVNCFIQGEVILDFKLQVLLDSLHHVVRGRPVGLLQFYRGVIFLVSTLLMLLIQQTSTLHSSATIGTCSQRHHSWNSRDDIDSVKQTSVSVVSTSCAARRFSLLPSLLQQCLSNTHRNNLIYRCHIVLVCSSVHNLH